MQVTSHQLRQQKEVEKQAAAEEAKRRDLAAKREVLTLPVSLMLSPPYDVASHFQCFTLQRCCISWCLWAPDIAAKSKRRGLN